MSATTTPAEGGGGESRVSHAPSFKLRFAAQREPGRSYVSLVKPSGLPETVTGKSYAGSEVRRETAAEREAVERALRRIRDKFELGPRERLSAPLTSAHEYGWWAGRVGGGERSRLARLRYALRDSHWMKVRLQLLAADYKLKHE